MSKEDLKDVVRTLRDGMRGWSMFDGVLIRVRDQSPDDFSVSVLFPAHRVTQQRLTYDRRFHYSEPIESVVWFFCTMFGKAWQPVFQTLIDAEQARKQATVDKWAALRDQALTTTSKSE